MSLEASVFFVVALLILCRLWVWFQETKLAPEPWGTELEHAVHGPEAVPVCPHCLAPQEHDGWFCPE